MTLNRQMVKVCGSHVTGQAVLLTTYTDRLGIGLLNGRSPNPAELPGKGTYETTQLDAPLVTGRSSSCATMRSTAVRNRPFAKLRERRKHRKYRLISARDQVRTYGFEYLAFLVVISDLVA